MYVYSKSNGTKILVNTVTKTIDIKSSGIPALAILLTDIKPVEWTIAFGGVPTGMIKTPRRLKREGYVEGIEMNNKGLYSITPKGQKLLQGWIAFLSAYPK